MMRFVIFFFTLGTLEWDGRGVQGFVRGKKKGERQNLRREGVERQVQSGLGLGDFGAWLGERGSESGGLESSRRGNLLRTSAMLLGRLSCTWRTL